MKRFMRNMAAGSLMLAVVLASCADEEWTVRQDVPFRLGEEGRMVKVELPFSLPRSMETTVVTRADGEELQVEDASLSGIHLAVFRDSETDDPAQDTLIVWKLYNNKSDPDGDGSGFWEDTGHGHGVGNDGFLRFYAPTGKVYIYLLANTIGTMFDFFYVDGEYTTAPQGINIRNRKEFFDIVRPKWKNNLVAEDGILPMTAMVDNEDGKCVIGMPETEGQTGETGGKIWYQNTEGEWVDVTLDNEDEAHTFMLRRMMSKVTFNVNAGTPADGSTIKFTPRNYTFRHVAQYVPAPPNTTPGEFWPEYMKNIPVVDSETRIFGTQSPNSFTVYLPENMRGHSTARNEEGKFTYAMRDKVKKDDDGKNTGEENSDIPGGEAYHDNHNGHYKFEYAPSGSTYVEITGHYERLRDGKVLESGDTQYIIHLGNFSEGEILDNGKGFNSFNLVRDRHYTFNVTVNGINDIETEVKGDGNNAPEEVQPGVEGIIFKEGAQLRLDAHYETVEMRFNKDAMQVADPKDNSGNKVPGIYIYTETPFGDMFGTYVFPENDGSQGKFYNRQGDELSLESVKPYFEWVSFRQQGQKGSLASYYQNGNPMSVFDALDAFWKNASGGSNGYIEYYTCFVDEYYYTKDPSQPGRVPSINEFVNKPDRTFSLASDVTYSADGKSGIASAVYVLKQRSIATFYDIDNQVAGMDYIYGLETVDELEGGDQKMESYGGSNNGDTKPTNTGIDEGRRNTIDAGATNGAHINWAKNGFLLGDDGEAYQVKPSDRMLSGNLEGRYACLTRNRDFDGNGVIDQNELRWYTPSLNQVLGIWVGEPGLPSSETALFAKDTQELKITESGGPDYDNNSQYPIFTSSGNNGRVVWGEEGCSFGPDSQAKLIGGRVRAVRTLSAGQASGDDYMKEPKPFYSYDNGNRTITLHLNASALRNSAIIGRELEPHHERDIAVNRPYRKLQIAKRPYVMYEMNVSKNFHCDKSGTGSSNRTATYTGYVLQTANATAAKTQQGASILSNYQDPGQTAAKWRLPNQRELALIVMEWDNLKTYYTTDLNQSDNGKGCNIVGRKAECVGSGLGFHVWHSWNESDEINPYLHCRTSFSNSKFFGSHQGGGYFRPYGYLYNIEAGIITMSVGVDAEGTAGYLGVRDVPE